MCFSVSLNTDIKKLAGIFNALVMEGTNNLHYKALGPSKKDFITVIYSDGSNLNVENMLWSLTPSWSKDFPVKWSTYNARMDRENKGKLQKIFDVPTFKNAFRSNRFCLIPITGAIGSCYWGETAGNIVEFGSESQDSFFVAGLWDEWVNKETGELIKSCTLLTDSPYDYFFKYGHDRSIMNLKKSAFEELLLNQNRSPVDSYAFLKSNRTSLDWIHRIDRALKPGWEKKVPNKEEVEQIERTVWRQ